MWVPQRRRGGRSGGRRPIQTWVGRGLRWVRAGRPVAAVAKVAALRGPHGLTIPAVARYSFAIPTQTSHRTGVSPMRRMLVLCATLLLIPAVGLAQGTDARRAFTPADWYRVTTLSSPAFSPDGKMIAFTVTTVVEKENRRHSEVWVAPVDGGEPYRVTSPGTESSNPRWSPDG